MSGFSDYKVDESEYAGRDIQSIEETVITGKADWLKARFDALSKDVIVAKYNDMLDYLAGAEAAGSIGSSGGTVQEELDGYAGNIAQAGSNAQAAYSQAQQAYAQAAQARQMAQTALENVDNALAMTDPFTGEPGRVSTIIEKLYQALQGYDAAVESMRSVAEESMAIASSASAKTAQLEDQLTAALTLYNPETGAADNMQNIVYMLYGYVKGDGMTAAELNAMGITAAEFNALNLTALAFNTGGIPEAA